MLIKDLPIEIQEIVFQKQQGQGNEPNAELQLSLDKKECNFNWDQTIEGYDFWEDINDGYFDDFYKKYPKKTKFKPGDKVKIINRHPDNTTGSPPFDKQSGMIAYVCHQDYNYYTLTSNKDNSGDYYGLLEINNQSNSCFKDGDLELIVEEPEINIYGLEVGDKLPQKVIREWGNQGLNYYGSSKIWEKRIGQFINDRTIEHFKIIDEIVAFKVSDTTSVYLKAEGFKEFMDNFDKPKLQVNKWYKWFWKLNYSKITYGKIDSIGFDCFTVSEGIHYNNYSKINGYYFNDCENIELLTDLSEIQQYLPEDHPDKIIPISKTLKNPLIKDFNELEEGGIYYTKFSKSEFIFEFSCYDLDNDSGEILGFYDSCGLDLSKDTFYDDVYEPLSVYNMIVLRDATEDEKKWLITCKKENTYIEKSVAIQKYDSYNMYPFDSSIIYQINKFPIIYKDKNISDFYRKPKNENQFFKIKTKNSLLDTSIEKVPTITTELKQKSKTIKF